jgi:pantoate--beta-alanine ligase
VRIVETVAELRAELRGRAVSCVPTMGNLHEGHLALMRIAKRHGSCTVATIFVNRLQFAPTEDFDKYPRTFADDCAKLEREGVDVVFLPAKEMYPVRRVYKIAAPELGDIVERVPPRILRQRVHGRAEALQRGAAAAAVFGKDYQRLRVIQAWCCHAADHDRSGETSRADDGLRCPRAATTSLRPSGWRRTPLPPAEKTARLIASGRHDYARLGKEAMAELHRHSGAGLRRRACQADLRPRRAIGTS